MRAIPTGVNNRLAKLTTVTDTNKDKTLADIYPDHFHCLATAGLLKGETPTLQQELQRALERDTVHYASSLVCGVVIMRLLVDLH